MMADLGMAGMMGAGMPPVGMPVQQGVREAGVREAPLQQQQRNTNTNTVAPRVIAHKKMRTGLPQGKVVVRSKGLNDENVRDSGKPLVQRNAPARRFVESERDTPRLREIPPSAHPHPTQLERERYRDMA